MYWQTDMQIIDARHYAKYFTFNVAKVMPKYRNGSTVSYCWYTSLSMSRVVYLTFSYYQNNQNEQFRRGELNSFNTRKHWAENYQKKKNVRFNSDNKVWLMRYVGSKTTRLCLINGDCNLFEYQIGNSMTKCNVGWL